jgi:hypothetical protein
MGGHWYLMPLIAMLQDKMMGWWDDIFLMGAEIESVIRKRRVYRKDCRGSVPIFGTEWDNRCMESWEVDVPKKFGS